MSKTNSPKPSRSTKVVKDGKTSVKQGQVPTHRNPPPPPPPKKTK